MQAWMPQLTLLTFGLRPRWGAPGPQLEDSMFGGGNQVTYPNEQCIPSVFETMVEDDGQVRFQLAFGVCLGCGFVAGPTDDMRTACAWAHDHTHPGWRDLPVLEHNQQWNSQRAAGKRDQMHQFIIGQMQKAGYPDKWIEDEWAPIVTAREKYATRCVPAYNHASRGYDLADVAKEVPPYDEAGAG